MVGREKNGAAARPPWYRSQTLRWALMASFVFWVLVYRLGGEVSQLPEFVYVNF